MLNTNLSFPAYTVDKLSMKFVFLVIVQVLDQARQ